MAKKSNSQSMSVSEFKIHCLSVFEKLRRDGQEIVISKHGEPIAKVLPLRKNVQLLRGSMKGQIVLLGDIVQGNGASDWDAAQ